MTMDWAAYIEEPEKKAFAELGKRIAEAHNAYRQRPERWKGEDFYDWCQREFGMSAQRVRQLERLGK